MRALRSRLALLLLLCFVRAMLPDTWVLALHQHEHTREEVAHVDVSTRAASKSRLLLTAKHQHCQTDHFNQVFAQLVRPLEIRLATVFAPSISCWVGTAWPDLAAAAHYLRGPPSF